MPPMVSRSVPSTTNSTASASGSGSGLSEPPSAPTSTTYQLNVSAKPESGRASTQPRVSRQCGQRLATMSRMVPRGSTA